MYTDISSPSHLYGSDVIIFDTEKIMTIVPIATCVKNTVARLSITVSQQLFQKVFRLNASSVDKRGLLLSPTSVGELLL